MDVDGPRGSARGLALPLTPMRIAEIFHSIQGEGALTGVPSVFVRTSGCNLRCVWCDTPYASWRPEGPEMSLEAIVAETRRLGARHVVLTGGEPMIARGMHELAAALRADGRHITIETAATIPPEGIACDLASLSPKLHNSAPDARAEPAWHARHERERWRSEVVRAWIDRREGEWQLKFVVTAAEDVAEIEGMLSEIGTPVPPDRVFLMPEGTSLEVLRSRAAWLVGMCRDRGYRYAHRLHVELFGNKRGT
jgi:7-carboxy-7-deazaguanine synthase